MGKKTSILFIGYYVENPEDYSGVSIAGNKMQGAIIDNLSKKPDIDLHVITIPPIAPFPKDHRLIVKKRLIKNNRYSITSISFVNIPIIKQLTQTISVLFELNRYQPSSDYVLTFNLFPQIGIPVYLHGNKKKIIPIIADLPIDDSKSRSIPSKILRHLFDKLTLLVMKTVEKVIVLNRNTANDFFNGVPYLVIEGGVNVDDKEKIEIKKKQKKTIVYTGALTVYSGVMNLIDAFKQLRIDGAELHIYGKGDLEKVVSHAASSLKNVYYFGSVSNTEIKRIQNEAFVLVNPRLVEDRISKYTFPSKLFEYLASGSVTVSTIHDGLPEEYTRYFFGVVSSSPESICSTLETVLQENEELLMKLAVASREFVVKEKNWKVQTDKILGFLKHEK